MFTNVAFKSLTPFYGNNKNTSCPTPNLISRNYCTPQYDDDDITIVTSNVSTQPPYEIAGSATHRQINHAIADSGATQIFVMEGTPVVNKCPTSLPLKVALADGCHVMSTHMCDIAINGLPTVLTGHIIQPSDCPSH